MGTTEIVLKRLVMRNFKGASERVTDFGYPITTISGRNGLGKSRHADAFAWCLTGKDTQDRKDYEIKTHSKDGLTLPKADASVELLFLVNGKEMKFKRVLVERWETPKGQADEVFKGNKTECYIDDVPMPVKEFELRVAGIITPEMLKLVTNPYYFAEIMPWKDRRDILLSLVSVENEEVAKDDAELQKLLEQMSGKSEEDFKRWLAMQIKAVKDKPAENEIRIRQIQEDMPQSEDWNDLQKQIFEAEQTLEDKQIRLNRLGEDNSHLVARKYELLGEIAKLQEAKREVVRKAEMAAGAEYAERMTDWNAQDYRKKSAEETIKHTHTLIDTNKENIERAQATIDTAVREKTELAERYDAVKTGYGNCPTCGGAMTEELAAKTLPTILQQIDDANAVIDKAQSMIDHFNSSNIDLLHNIAEAEQTIAEIGELVKPEKRDVSAENIPEVQTIAEDIKRAQEALDGLTKGLDESEADKCKEEIIAIKQTISSLQLRLANRKRINELQQRISELQAESRSCAEERARLERMQYNFMQLQIRKADLLTERIDGLFGLVKFKMFDYTIEGNPVETCVPMIGGVPYPSANSAAKLNAGLDIINTLSKHYGYTAPIWIDNAESVNKILPTDAQQIRLVVSDEPTLNVR